MLSTWFIRAGGTRQARSQPRGGDVGQDLTDRVDVAALGLAELDELLGKHQNVQHTDTEASPIGAVLGSQPIHGDVGTKPGQEPSAVGDRAKAEQVLVAGLLDGLPGGPAAGFVRYPPA